MKERIEFKTYTKMSKNSLVDYKDLIIRAKELGQDSIALTDFSSVEIFPKVYRYLKENNIEDFKAIYGTTINMLENDFLIPVTILVRNQEGLKNLYEIISLIKTSNYSKYGKQVIMRNELTSFSKGLLYGLDVLSMYDIYDNQTDEQVGQDLMWYDFLEVNSSDSSLKDYIERIIAIAKNNRKIVIATGDVHYLKKEEKEDYRIIFSSEDNKADKYLKSTTEMCNDFSFLNQDITIEIVQKNTRKLGDLIENIDISSSLFLPKMENSKEDLLKLINTKVSNLYGNKIPKEIAERINEELYGKTGTESGIINKNYEVIYLIYQKLVEYSNKLGYPTQARGKVSSSFIAYLLGITDVNPLPAHYYCPNCHEVIFNSKYLYGVDMPSKKCSKCAKEMTKDGFTIPYQTLLGMAASKVPDIDMNFSCEIWDSLLNYLKDFLGENKVLKAGTIGTYSYDVALKRIDENSKKLNLTLKEEKRRLASKLQGVKTTTGNHPGSLIIIPKDKDITDFTPITYPSNLKESSWQTTHFDYHDLRNNLLKLDILASPIPTIFAKLTTLTKVKLQDIPLDDPNVFKHINEGIDTNIFTFDKYLNSSVFKRRNPRNFNELLKTVSICHNRVIEDLTNKYDISCREDIFTYLTNQNVDSSLAYKIMEFIGTCKHKINVKTWENLKDQMLALKVSKSFIDDCSKIYFFLPASHLVNLTLNLYRLAWYKSYFPTQFQEVLK